MFLMSAPISNGAANIAHITMFVCSSTALSPPQQMQGASGCSRSTQYLQQRPARTSVHHICRSNQADSSNYAGRLLSRSLERYSHVAVESS
eukprot:COSAG06_NODE_109_length_23526_cov_4.928843_7_plen_91_part_00